jgi:hypothetical protein
MAKRNVEIVMTADTTDVDAAIKRIAEKLQAAQRPSWRGRWIYFGAGVCVGFGAGVLAALGVM